MEEEVKVEEEETAEASAEAGTPPAKETDYFEPGERLLEDYGGTVGAWFNMAVEEAKGSGDPVTFTFTADIDEGGVMVDATCAFQRKPEKQKSNTESINLKRGPGLFDAVNEVHAEPHQIPAEPPHAVELARAALVPSSEGVVGDDDVQLNRVIESPGLNEYVVEGQNLTFNAERAGQYVYVSYSYVEKDGPEGEGAEGSDGTEEAETAEPAAAEA